MLRLCALTALTLTALPAQAEDAERTLVYRDALGGVYYQDWYVADEKRFAAGIRTTQVIGDGKSGDFEGELYIDCPNPAASKWLSVNGDHILDDGDVPPETIRAIRLRLCDD